MFKHTDKRFEYDIGSNTHDDFDRYEYKYTNYRNPADHPISTTTPLNRRASHHTTADPREKHHNSTQDPILFQDTVDDRLGYRSRGNSTSGFKRSVEKLQPRNDRSYLQQENLKQTKKVYFGEDELIAREPETTGIRQNKQYRSSYRNDQNRRLNGQDQNSFQLYDTAGVNTSKGNVVPEGRKRSGGSHWASIPEHSLNEQEIMQKICRINKLNEEINGRLQRMLSKIEHG